MASITVLVPGVAAPVATAPTGSRQALIASDSGVKLALPFAPVESQLDGMAGRWDTVDRAGRAPLVRYRGGQNATLSFEVILARLDGEPVEDLLDKLGKLAAGAQRLTISGLSVREEGPWRLDGCSVSVAERAPDNSIREARVSLSFRAASDVTVAESKLPAKTGPLTGGVAKPPTVPPAATTRQHTVRSGDTLWAIARTYLGNPERWQEIAAANAAIIRNPNLIFAGQVLTIPGS